MEYYVLATNELMGVDGGTSDNAKNAIDKLNDTLKYMIDNAGFYINVEKDSSGTPTKIEAGLVFPIPTGSSGGSSSSSSGCVSYYSGGYCYSSGGC